MEGEEKDDRNLADDPSSAQSRSRDNGDDRKKTRRNRRKKKKRSEKRIRSGSSVDIASMDRSGNSAIYAFVRFL